MLSKVSVNSDCLQIEFSFCQLTYLIIFSLNDKKNRILHVIMPWQHVNLLPVKSLYHVLLSPFHQLHLWSIWDNWNFLWTIFSQTLCFDFLLCQLAQLSLEFLSLKLNLVMFWLFDVLSILSSYFSYRIQLNLKLLKLQVRRTVLHFENVVRLCPACICASLENKCSTKMSPSGRTPAILSCLCCLVDEVRMVRLS